MAILTGGSWLGGVATPLLAVAVLAGAGCAATCEAAADHVRSCADDVGGDGGGDDDDDKADDVREACDAVPEAGRGVLADCIVAATCEDVVAAPDPIRLCARPAPAGAE